MAARGPDDRVINSLPLPHVYGSCVFNASIMAGSMFIMICAMRRWAVEEMGRNSVTPWTRPRTAACNVFM